MDRNQNSIRTKTILLGNPDLLREKLLSIPDHISNIHSYPANEHYTECTHPPLTGDRAKAWLAPGSLVFSKLKIFDLKQIIYQAVKKVKTALLGKDGSRVKDLSSMVGFTHTGPIGSFNKKIFFDNKIPANFGPLTIKTEFSCTAKAKIYNHRI